MFEFLLELSPPERADYEPKGKPRPTRTEMNGV